MQYDPVKNIFAGFIKRSPALRVLFYKILDLMFLRSWFVRRELRRVRNSHGENHLNILDAGTGYGQYTYFMTGNLPPCSIHAVDVKEDWINDCREFYSQKRLNQVTLSVEDLTKYSAPESYDLIVCVDVMEHIEDDISVFRNFYASLKPGGRVIINSPSIYGGSDVHDDDDESFIGEHARDGYSIEDLKEKLEPFGFKVESANYTYGFWGDKAWRLGIKYPIMMVNASKVLLAVLPVYYLLTFPFTYIMMQLDFRTHSPKGSGIMLTAKK